MLYLPDDPFLKDAEGAARFCRDLLARRFRKRWLETDWDAAIYWSARWAAHWAMKSKAFASLATEGR